MAAAGGLLCGGICGGGADSGGRVSARGVDACVAGDVCWSNRAPPAEGGCVVHDDGAS